MSIARVLATRLVDPSVPRSELVRLAAGMTPAKLAAPLSQTVSNGKFVEDMRNYWLGTTHVYYFPGLYTAVLPMIPGIVGIRRVLRASRVAS